jgi:hypothetical protein
MKNEGLIDPDTAADLLDYPDLDSQTQVRIAPVRLIIQQIESILLEGKEATPEPFQNIDLAIKFGNFYQNWARLNDFPEDRIESVRQYVEDCVSMKTMGQQAQPAITPAGQMQAAQLGAPVNEQGLPGQVLSPQTF